LELKAAKTPWRQGLALRPLHPLAAPIQLTKSVYDMVLLPLTKLHPGFDRGKKAKLEAQKLVLGLGILRGGVFI